MYECIEIYIFCFLRIMFPLSISPSSLFICSAVSLSLYLSVFNLVQYSENLYEACVIYLIHTFVACLLIQFALSLSNEKILFSKNQPNRCCCLFTLNSTHTYNWKLCIVIVTDGDPGFISPFLFASMQTNKAPIHTRRKQYITYYTHVGLCYRKKITRYFFEKIRFIFLLATLITKSTVFWFDFFSPI